jgi:plastocyanin domain-containing protein
MIIVNILGITLIGLIIWWFWLYKPQEAKLADDALVITVDNGTYQPSHIRIEANTPSSLHFLRKDASPCAEMVLIPAIELSESLPLDKVKTLTLPPLAPGEYDFHCQMQMYRGVLKAE